MASYNRPYQGYPYVNPPVIDAPSIDQETASRWTNLPRKQIRVPAKKSDQPVVYVDVPEDRPGTSAVVEEAETQTNDSAAKPTVSFPVKKEIEVTPVVYIDMPENNNGDMAQSTEETDNNEPEFETIFYDPFEDRRIDRTDRTKVEESDTVSDASSVHSMTRPTRLDFNSPNTSGYNNQPSNSSGVPSFSSNSPMIPPMLSKETLVYGGNSAGDFSISPIPISSFPEPPPAYTEIDRVSPAQVVAEQPSRLPAATTPPPRTQVITPMNQNNSDVSQGSPIVDHQIPIGMPNTDRKHLHCHHCGMRVHTLVVKEMGTVAIIVSVLCLLICMLPIIFWIYTTSCMKNKNHYCPNCNKLIGYQQPCDGDKVTYVD